MFLCVQVANSFYTVVGNLQEESLQSLQNRIDVAYDSTIPLHQVQLYLRVIKLLEFLI